MTIDELKINLLEFIKHLFDVVLFLCRIWAKVPAIRISPITEQPREVGIDHFGLCEFCPYGLVRKWTHERNLNCHGVNIVTPFETGP